MTILETLTAAPAATIDRLAGHYDRPSRAKWDNRPTWDNGKRFDNRPTWDNWNKK